MTNEVIVKKDFNDITKVIEDTEYKNLAVNTGDGIQVNAPVQDLHINQKIYNFCLTSGNGKVTCIRTINPEYCNIFVTKYNFSDNFLSFNLDKKRALTEDCVTGNLFLNYLNTNILKDIKKFPSLFITENGKYRRCKNPAQNCYFGLVTDIIDCQNKISVNFHKYLECPIPQQQLNEKLRNLWEEINPKYDILDRTHWIIRKIDILEKLRNAGFSIDLED
jgi:hypothetical protein